MSSFSKSSLDHDWELATTRTSSSRDQTISDDDDDEDLLAAADEDLENSELGDEWEGIDSESQSESQDHPQTTPLQAQRVLSADADDDAGVDLSASAESSTGPSENSGTDSTFSFHFPDPLEASREYAEAAPVDGEMSDADTNSVLESDVVGLSMSIGALERSTTLVVPLARSSSIRSSPSATSSISTSSISSRFPSAAYVSSVFVAKRLTRRSFDSRFALTALAIACVALPGVYHSMLSRSQVPTQSIISTLPAPSYDFTETLSLVTPLPLIEAPISIPTPYSETWSNVEPSAAESLEPAPAPSALTRNRDPISAVASTYMSFSNLVLRDLHDVLRVIDELLSFIRSRSIADAKRSILEYIALKFADRHERAKINARKLWGRVKTGVV